MSPQHATSTIIFIQLRYLYVINILYLYKIKHNKLGISCFSYHIIIEKIHVPYSTSNQKYFKILGQQRAGCRLIVVGVTLHLLEIYSWT